MQQIIHVPDGAVGRTQRGIPYAVFAWVGTLSLLAAGTYYALTGLLQIVNFGWHQLMFDQYKMYPHYLELPFPQNAIQLENGHRPLLPILLRLAEIRWFAANQTLQLTVGACSAFLMASIVSVAAWRDRSMSMPIRAACMATAFIGIFWLANSRMLLHGNEMLVVYLLGFFVLVGALCVHKAAFGSASRWMLGATAAAVAATFCFGSGIAAFPALAVVAWISRVPIRSIGWLGVGLGFSLVVYLWVLPGNEGVRAMLELRPIDSIETAARWIGSPWVNAWLGYADPPLYPWLAWGPGDSPLAHLLIGSANFLQRVSGTNLRTQGSLLIGLCGFLVVGVFLIRHAIRRAPLSRIENLALTLALFGAAIALVIGIGRLDYLVEHQDQVFADRYLPWSCMFWLGCSILLMCRLDHTAFAVRVAIVVVSITVPIVLFPSHKKWAEWGEATFRNSQTSAAAALSGVYDARRFPNDDSAKTEDVVRTLSLLKQQRLGMFSSSHRDFLGKPVVITDSDSPSSVLVYGAEMFPDALSGSASMHFQGTVGSGIKWISRNGILAVVDGENRVSGFALPSFVGKAGNPPRLNVPRMRGFDGYIRFYNPSTFYRLILLDAETGTAIVISDIGRSTARHPDK